LLDAFQKAKTIYPIEVVRNAEKIYRYETDNFTTDSFYHSFSAGMGALTLIYPFGWNSLVKFWTKQQQNKPIGTTPLKNNEGMPTVVFATIDAGLNTLCQFLQENYNSVGLWHSVSLGEQVAYAKAIESQVTPYTDFTA
jgi:hypothetical protein